MLNFCNVLSLTITLSNVFSTKQRYFVLSESTTCFCVLRIFTRAVPSAWGPLAVGLKASIPIYSIEAVESVAAPAAKGKELTIKFHPRVSKDSLKASSARPSSREVDDGDNASDAGSEFSDSMFATGGTKTTTLLAEDAEVRATDVLVVYSFPTLTTSLFLFVSMHTDAVALGHHAQSSSRHFNG